jgi:type VI secretion system protein ImpJ
LNKNNFVIIKRKYGIYIAPINDREIINNSFFIFAVSSDVSPEKLKEILVSSLKFGTVETIKFS